MVFPTKRGQSFFWMSNRFGEKKLARAPRGGGFVRKLSPGCVFHFSNALILRVALVYSGLTVAA
jgi:hypothetical protein